MKSILSRSLFQNWFTAQDLLIFFTAMLTLKSLSLSTDKQVHDTSIKRAIKL